MKIAVVTPLAWKSLPSRVSELSRKISALLPEKVSIDVIQRPVGQIPLDAHGRPQKAWLKKTLALDGYDGACLLFDRSHAPDLKLIKGFYVRDQGYLEFWVCSKEKTKDKSYFGNLRFERTFAHELAHGLYDWTGHTVSEDESRAIPGRDSTHYWDSKVGKCEEAYREIARAWPKPKKPSPVPEPKGNLEGVDPRLADFSRRLAKTMAELGKPVFVFEGFRSMERQAELYAQGRTKPGKIVTHAKPGESLHNTGRAVDIIFEKTLWSNPETDWQLLGMMGEALAKSMGLPITWGGRWKGIPDRPHWEIA